MKEITFASKKQAIQWFASVIGKRIKVAYDEKEMAALETQFEINLGELAESIEELEAIAREITQAIKERNEQDQKEKTKTSEMKFSSEDEAIQFIADVSGYTIRIAEDLKVRIQQAFENSKDIPGHLEGIFKQRNEGAGGSKFKTKQTIESLVNADWKPYNHPAVKGGAKAFKAPIPGYMGLIELDSLPDDSIVTLDDGHETGFLSVTVPGKRSQSVNFTVLLVGDHGGKEVVYTFHPGDPVRPSSLPDAGDYKKGDQITVKEAKDLGFNYGKIVD